MSTNPTTSSSSAATAAAAAVQADAATVAKIAATIAAALGTTPAGQDAALLAQIATDIGVDAGAASFADIVQAAISGQYGDQAAQLFLMHFTPADAARAAIEQYDAHWQDTYGALPTPQAAFDGLSGGVGAKDEGVFGRIKHDDRHSPLGFLVDGEFAFEPVRRAVWKLAHQATYALLLLKHPEWAGQIQNEDLAAAAS